MIQDVAVALHLRVVGVPRLVLGQGRELGFCAVLVFHRTFDASKPVMRSDDCIFLRSRPREFARLALQTVLRCRGDTSSPP